MLLSNLDVDELQAILSTLDDLFQDSALAIKAELYRLERTVIRMYQEEKHARPHFHITYKREYNASYAIGTLEKLAGHLPARYENPMLAWARQRRQALLNTWNKMQAGEMMNRLMLEAPGQEA